CLPSRDEAPLTIRGRQYRAVIRRTVSGATDPEAPFRAGGARDGAPRVATTTVTSQPAQRKGVSGVVYHFDLVGKLGTSAVDRIKLLGESKISKSQGITMEQLVERVKAIVLTPQTEWPIIAREPGDTAGLFTRYVAILALIPALAGFIGTSLIGRY